MKTGTKLYSEDQVEAFVKESINMWIININDMPELPEPAIVIDEPTCYMYKDTVNDCHTKTEKDFAIKRKLATIDDFTPLYELKITTKTEE